MTQEHEDPPTFASVLEQLRKARGLSQAQLARALKVYDGNVSRWRHGQGIELENVRKIADFFGVDRGWLEALAFGGDTAPDPDRPDPELQARIAQIASYASTFKSEYRPIFWDNITTQASTLAASLQQIGSTAISTHGHDAISGDGSGSEERREDHRRSRKRALAASLPTLRHQLVGGLRSMGNVPAALSALLAPSPSRQLAA